MKRKVLQFIGDNIINVLNVTHNEDMFYYYYNVCCMLDAYATQFHDIYLD